MLIAGCDEPLPRDEPEPQEALEVVTPLAPLEFGRSAPPALEAPAVASAWVVDSFGFLYADEQGAVAALDIDGRASVEGEPEGGDSCDHGDFSAEGDQVGVDHQFLRVTDTFESLLPGGIADQIISNSAKDGSMTLLMTVDDTQVRLVIGEDAPLTGNDGEVLSHSTFRPYPDAAYHAALPLVEASESSSVAGPGEVRLRLNIQIVEADLYLTDAYVRVVVDDAGRAHGVIQGYWSIESIIEILASTSAHLLALGYSREEFEGVLAQHADGGRDEAGVCHTLSAAFRFTAVPAYLLDDLEAR